MAANIMPMGCRSTRPRRSRVRPRFSTEPETAVPNARASSTARLACSKTSPCPSCSQAGCSLSIATSSSFTPSARDDLSNQVAERQGACEADDGPLADELRGLVDRLIHRRLGLLHDPLGVLRAEVAEDARAETVSGLLHIDHGGTLRKCAQGGAERPPARACRAT